MRKRDAVRGAKIAVRTDLGLSSRCLSEDVLGADSDIAIELGFDGLDAVEVGLRDLNRGYHPRFDLLGELCQG